MRLRIRWSSLRNVLLALAAVAMLWCLVLPELELELPALRSMVRDNDQPSSVNEDGARPPPSQGFLVWLGSDSEAYAQERAWQSAAVWGDEFITYI